MHETTDEYCDVHDSHVDDEFVCECLLFGIGDE